jgi:hypothetical protein
MGPCSLQSRINMSSETLPLAVVANEHQIIDNASQWAPDPEERILAALQEIPHLAREDVLKAYTILCHDSNGRRFWSLLGLPVNLKKDLAVDGDQSHWRLFYLLCMHRKLEAWLKYVCWVFMKYFCLIRDDNIIFQIFIRHTPASLVILLDCAELLEQWYFLIAC